MYFGISYHENINNWATKGLIEAATAMGNDVKPFRLPDVAAEIPHKFTHLEDEDISQLDGMIVRTIGLGQAIRLHFESVY